MAEYMSHFMIYWSPEELHANIIIFLNLSGALMLGFVVGYERFYHGRAAGMRTYGLVCMASAALVVIAGYPDFWYGGKALHPVALDPTRIIQGIVTGIGFLGAGVIMKEGFTISGLTTAASVWASSAIGVMVGVGFYAAAILLSLLSAACMVFIHRLEEWLPSRAVIAISMRFKPDFQPHEPDLIRLAHDRGYDIGVNTLSITKNSGVIEWRFVAVARDKRHAATLSHLSREIDAFPGVDSFTLAHAKN